MSRPDRAETGAAEYGARLLLLLGLLVLIFGCGSPRDRVETRPERAAQAAELLDSLAVGASAWMLAHPDHPAADDIERALPIVADVVIRLQAGESLGPIGWDLPRAALVAWLEAEGRSPAEIAGTVAALQIAVGLAVSEIVGVDR